MPNPLPRPAALVPEQAELRGRPRGTSARELELIALDLFTTRGFEQTTVDDIATAAGVSRRTFFRYFDSKAAVLWHEFDNEVVRLSDALASVPDSVPLMATVRQAVTSVNRYRAEDQAELRTRMRLVGSVPALQASAALHYDAWEQVIIDFAAQRLGVAETSLIPRLIGRTTLAACRAAYEQWITEPGTDLAQHLGRALDVLTEGFARCDTRAGRSSLDV